MRCSLQRPDHFRETTDLEKERDQSCWSCAYFRCDAQPGAWYDGAFSCSLNDFALEYIYSEICEQWKESKDVGTKHSNR